eukprot:TRINITY_DN9410_c0_g1_i1.p1 TRINITY_DN9410_c0_g1~~TRINITY_DN9410_c0_g1_i1.p1  ORF type:complete len:259 (+),score=42.89 TRINITY_DN9410_c0_g1_i1:71-778(+)
MDQFIQQIRNLTSFMHLAMKSFSLLVAEWRQERLRYEQQHTALQKLVPELFTALQNMKQELAEMRITVKRAPRAIVSECTSVCQTLYDAQDLCKRSETQHLSNQLFEVWEKRNEGFALAKEFKRQYLFASSEAARYREQAEAALQENKHLKVENERYRTSHKKIQETLGHLRHGMAQLKAMPSQLTNQVIVTKAQVTSQINEIKKLVSDPHTRVVKSVVSDGSDLSPVRIISEPG